MMDSGNKDIDESWRNGREQLDLIFDSVCVLLCDPRWLERYTGYQTRRRVNIV